MNRRDFLKALGITATAVVTPKLIFDLGAVRYKDTCVWQDRLYVVNRDLCTVHFSVTSIQQEPFFKDVLTKFYEDMKKRSDILPIVNGYYVLPSPMIK